MEGDANDFQRVVPIKHAAANEFCGYRRKGRRGRLMPQEKNDE
jgi:hypothetical protein